MLLDALVGWKADFSKVLSDTEKIEVQRLLESISQINRQIKSQPSGKTSAIDELYKQLDAARLK